MATQVAGELYETVTGQLFEIGRQLRQPNGYPFDPAQLKIALQNAIEGKFGDHIIDFDAAPFIPDGWSVLPDSEQLSNRIRGKVKFDPTKVILHLDDGQKNGKSTEGNKLREKLAIHSVYGVQLLDFYLANPHLIPEEWKGKYVFFWGTIYRSPGGNLCVRYLYWDGDRWRWVYGWLDGGWVGSNPAALRAS